MQFTDVTGLFSPNSIKQENVTQPTIKQTNGGLPRKTPQSTSPRQRLCMSVCSYFQFIIVTSVIERYWGYLHPGISVSSFRGGTVSNVLAYFLAACLCWLRASISFLVLGIRHLNIQHRVITERERGERDRNMMS